MVIITLSINGAHLSNISTDNHIFLICEKNKNKNAEQFLRKKYFTF